MDTPAWDAAARLLRRTGFGTTGSEVDAALKVGLDAWLAAALRADPASDPGVAATPAPAFAPPAALPKGATVEQRKERRQQVAEQDKALVTWWVRRMVAARNPVVEKLTLGWHNHFATSAAKVRVAGVMLAQNETLRTLGRGSFTSLANAMVTDAAMLHWLDGDTNTVKAPNENLSREFMELFVLGHGGGYTEQDVREGARSLTGWRIGADGKAVLDRKRQDTGSKTVLGVTGNLDAAQFVGAVLAQPAAPAYLATRWWQVLVAPTAPPQAALDRMLTAYGSGRDLTTLFTAMLTDPALAGSPGSLVVTPVEWLVGAARALRVPNDEATIAKFLPALRALGQTPFFPPNVSGWPSGQAWLSTASAGTRLQAARALVMVGDLHEIEAAGATTRVEAVAHLLGLTRFSDRTAAQLRTVTKDPKQLVATALVSPEYLVN